MYRRRLLLISLCFLLFLTLVPFQSVFAFDQPIQKGTIVSGQKYSGSLTLNNYMGTIPEEYALNLPQNSMIRLFAYSQAKDYFVEIDSPDNPYAAPESYSCIGGTDVTQIYESREKQEPQRFGTSSLGVTCRWDNPSGYTEMYTNLIGGSYKLRIRGGVSYSFVVMIIPLKYADDIPVMSNEDISTAMNIQIDRCYDGNIMFNGVINKQFFKDQGDYYTFNAPKPGKYTITLASDGFFQGTACIMNSSGSSLNGASAEIFLNLSTDGSEATTFERHLASARTDKKEFTIDKAGKYYVVVKSNASIAGSYQFKVSSPKDAVIKALIPQKATLNMKVGKFATNKITAVYSDGTKRDVTQKVILSSSNKCVTIYKNGALKANYKGKAKITAKLNGVKTSYIVVVG